MKTAPKPSFFIKPSFLDKDSADISWVSLGTFAIVVLLSIAFLWYEANSPPPSQSSRSGVINHGVINHGALTPNLVPATSEILPKTPFQFTSNTSARLFSADLIATMAPDNTMWRCTKDGWQDISMAADPPPVNKPLLEGVHPIIWTAMLLTASLLLLIMASSDEEINKLLSQANARTSNH